MHACWLVSCALRWCCAGFQCKGGSNQSQTQKQIKVFKSFTSLPLTCPLLLPLPISVALPYLASPVVAAATTTPAIPHPTPPHPRNSGGARWCCVASQPNVGTAHHPAAGLERKGAGGSLATGPGSSAVVGVASRFCRGRAVQGNCVPSRTGCYHGNCSPHDQWSPW